MIIKKYLTGILTVEIYRSMFNQEPPVLEVTQDNEGVTLKACCPQCGRETKLELDNKYAFSVQCALNGIRVQYALPQLSAAQRESLFISGLCEECWDKMLDDPDIGEQP